MSMLVLVCGNVFDGYCQLLCTETMAERRPHRFTRLCQEWPQQVVKCSAIFPPLFYAAANEVRRTRARAV